jgi:tetratricopeptide (TPR) repeat protein
VIFWEKLRTELGRYGDGVHEPGAPADRARLSEVAERLGLPAPLVELYRSFDGLRLFTDSFVIAPSGEIARHEGELALGESLGAPLILDGKGRVFVVDEAGDRLLVASSLPRFVDGLLAREKLVHERDGEYKDVFSAEGELAEEVRKKRARAGLKVDPDSAAYRLEAAELAFEAGREDEARAELERATTADPRAVAAWALLAALAERANRLSEAEAAYAHAAESTRDRAQRTEWLAEAAHAAARAGREPARAGLASRAIAEDADAPARWLEEAERRLAEGDADGAQKRALLVEAVAPGRAAEILKRARVRAKLKLL